MGAFCWGLGMITVISLAGQHWGSWRRRAALMRDTAAEAPMSVAENEQTPRNT